MMPFTFGSFINLVYWILMMHSAKVSTAVTAVAKRQIGVSARSFVRPMASQGSVTVQRQRISCLSMLRGGGSGGGKRPQSSSLLQRGQRIASITTDTSADNAELPRILHRYPVSGCAAIGWRPYMEDEALIQSDVVACFDGHGGASVSRYVRQNLYGHLQAILPRVVNDRQATENAQAVTPQDYKATLHLALEKINNEVMRILHWSYQGSTAVVCWLHEAPATADRQAVQTLVAANIGDSRLVLSRNGQAIALSRDHKPNDPIEMAYIQSQGGKVTYPSGVPRVNGVMALSRAIGDRSETPSIRAEPDLILEELSPEDDFYLLATDGLWDVMSNQDVVNFLHQFFDGDVTDDSRQEWTKQLVVEALERGAEDNITVLVVWLR